MTIEIYWNDLTTEKQNEIRDALGMDANDDGNWTYVPMTTMEIEEE
jgi:hypothetical protein